MVQNDLDYYMEHGVAQNLKQGDKYGYDYYAYVFDETLWGNLAYNQGNFKANLALEGGYNEFWREGLVRKGLFPGLNPDGTEYMVDGKSLTTYEMVNGKLQPITSKGRSAVSEFFTYSAKLGLEYQIIGGHRFYGNAGYFNDAPTFSQSFISPRTRN